jgi:NAD-specific glutamate dehydrogenase
MARPATLYADDLGDRDPVAAMRETSARIEQLAATWSASRWDASYAAGKWSARQVVTHLAQSEMALGARVRMALVTPNYVAQNFSQNEWLAREPGLGAQDALAAFLAMGRMNRALFDTLSEADRAIGLSHPLYGAFNIDWVIHQMAGHQIHHLRHLEQIAGRA